ncbi:MAG: DNA-3-methyladenine glycosylase I [Bdellovibrionota bacterium]
MFKEKKRCPWPGEDPLMIQYHDQDWGVIKGDDRRHFEFLVLEAAQAGLSWRTVLHKREGYRKAFSGFDPKKVARYDGKKVASLLKDAGIIRNRLKIKSAILNAKLFLEIQKEFGSFDKYCWQFVDGKTIVNKRRTIKDIPATTPESDAMSKDLKARGFKFVGSTVIYAHMQAVGMVNDHLLSCFRYKESGKKR